MLTHRKLSCKDCSTENGHVATSRGLLLLRRFSLSEGTHTGKIYSAAAPQLLGVQCFIVKAALPKNVPRGCCGGEAGRKDVMAAEPKWPALMGSNAL